MQNSRKLIAAAVEILIDALDRIDGDPDLEPDTDGEPDMLELDSPPVQAETVRPRTRKLRHG